MSSIYESFHSEARMYDTIYVHNEKPIFIVYYDAKHIEDRLPFYQVYEVIEKLKKGHKIWAHNNKLISPKDGFKTLDEAMEFCA